MDRALARFAGWVVARQGLMLLAVVVLIVMMARWVYMRSLQTVTDAAGARQMMLAQQTARGIESYYASIIETLDLIRRTSHEEPTTQSSSYGETAVMEFAEPLPATQPAMRVTIAEVVTPNQPGAVPAGPPPRGPSEHRPPPGILERIGSLKDRQPLPRPQGITGPMARQLLLPVFWEQLRGRVSQLFLLDRPTMRVLSRFAEAESLPAEQIVELRRAWLENLEETGVSKVGELGGRWGNLIAVPLPGERRMICAVVPMENIEAQFLNDISADRRVGTMIMDEAGRILSFNDRSLVGKLMAEESHDPMLGEIVTTTLAGEKAVTQIFREPINLGGNTYPPGIITVYPLAMPNGRWWVSISTGMSVVEGVVDSIFRRILIFTSVTIGVFAFAFSRLAINQIRQRAQLERVKGELLQSDIEQARRIQLAWLPDEKRTVAGLDVSAINKAANHISGDFYNWFELADGRICIVIGDVTGHGMSAAFLMATTQLLLRAAMQRLNDPGKALEATNNELCQQVLSGQFVTILLAAVDTATGRIDIANAGHPPPVVIENGAARLLPVKPQLVAGLEADWEYPTEQFHLDPAASLLLYTDGVPDAPSEDGRRFDDAGLLQSMSPGAATAKAMIEMLVTDIDRFRGSKELSDDVTVVAVRFVTAAEGANNQGKGASRTFVTT